MTRKEACYFLGIREDADEEQIKRRIGIRQSCITLMRIPIQIPRNTISRCRRHMNI